MARVEMNGQGLSSLKEHILGKVADVALAVGVDAEAMAPVRTGELKSSIRVDVSAREEGRWRISAGTGLPDGRAVYNELGTHNEDGSVRMHEQPYLRPALFQKRAL